MEFIEERLPLIACQKKEVPYFKFGDKVLEMDKGLRYGKCRDSVPDPLGKDISGKDVPVKN